MRMTRAVLPVLLVFGLCGCSKPVSSDQQAAVLIREANQLLAESSKSNDWAGKFGKAFNPQSRAQFPANREWLRAQSESILKQLNEDSRFANEAIAKYERASGLITNEQQRKGTTSIVAALKKSVQINDLFKSQMQLVSDDKITDEKTFNARFMQIVEQIGQVKREQETHFDEGKRLLGM